jgi:hypothetical protein
MVALPLLDIVLASRDADRSARVANQMARSALAELDEIENLDDGLAPDDASEFDRQTAYVLRGMYERWAQDAELLLERIGRVEQQAGPVPGAEALRRVYGRTRARLSVSLDDMEQGLRDAVEGRTVPIEEVRRELRVRVQQTGAESIPANRTVAGRGNT